MRQVILVITAVFILAGCFGNLNESRIAGDFTKREMTRIGEVSIEPETEFCREGLHVFSLSRNTNTLSRFLLGSQGGWTLEKRVTIPAGKGPGDAVQTSGMTLTPDGFLLVTDSDLNRLDLFDKDLRFRDAMALDQSGTLMEGEGMIAPLGAGRLALCQANLQRRGYEMVLFHYGLPGETRGFGREVEIDLNRLETFTAATGKIYSRGTVLFRLTYEPMLYVYNGTELIERIDPNLLLKPYGIRLAMPGAESRRVNKKKKASKGIPSYSLLQNGVNGTIALVVKDLSRNRMLVLEFDHAGAVIRRWMITSDSIREEGLTSLFLYGDEYAALSGPGSEFLELFRLN